jgi:hypothetical protein
VDLQILKKRQKAMYQERQSWENQWKDCSRFIMPMAGRFNLEDRNKGDKKFLAVYDNTAIRANKVYGAGMMAGMTSPARPWFRLAHPDPNMMELDSVRLWLDQVTKTMRLVFAKSNLYKTLHTMYEELGCFGTAAAYIERDFDNIVHTTPLTCGEYAIAQNSKGKVDTLVREYQVTVSQLVTEFGFDACSDNVKQKYTTGNLDAWVTVTHFVLPRHARDLAKPDNKNKKWASIYYESGESGNKVLRESGYDRFPYLVARASLSGGNVYGISSGMEALGPTKQLQHQQLRKSQVIDYKSNPPLQMPAGYKAMEVNTLPGGHSYVDMTTANGGIRSAFEVQLDIGELGQDIQDVRKQIEATFFVDLFLMLANDQRSGVTAREVDEKHEEKMLMLGPLLERLHYELIEPTIEIVFDAVVEATTDSGPLIPPAPDELQGVDLKVDFISTLAQAQKQIGLGTIDRFVAFVGQAAQVKPESLDKIDLDQAIDVYGDLLGVDPAIVVADDKVAEIRGAREQKMAQQEQMQQMAAMAQPMDQMASAMQKAGGTTADEGTALNTLLQGLQGYA